MRKPGAATVAFFEGTVPDDARAKQGQMFGHPCAFVNGNMFYGTFGDSVVIRVGEARATQLAVAPVRIFAPMEGRAWKEYLQVDVGAMPEGEVATLAREALDFTATLPAKVKKAPKPKAKKA